MKKRISALPGSGQDLDDDDDDHVKLVNIDCGVDILDFDIGDGHIVILTAKEEVWAAGDNEMGQLGIGIDQSAKIEQQQRNTKRDVHFKTEWVRKIIQI